jgi:hypothetical protein
MAILLIFIGLGCGVVVASVAIDQALKGNFEVLMVLGQYLACCVAFIVTASFLGWVITKVRQSMDNNL